MLISWIDNVGLLSVVLYRIPHMCYINWIELGRHFDSLLIFCQNGFQPQIPSAFRLSVFSFWIESKKEQSIRDFCLNFVLFICFDLFLTQCLSQHFWKYSILTSLNSIRKTFVLARSDCLPPPPPLSRHLFLLLF